MPTRKGAALRLPGLGLDLSVTGGDVTLNEGMAPYGQATVQVVVPAAADRARIDPRKGLRATLTLTDTRSPWGGLDTTRTLDLGLRARPVLLTEATMELSLATDEALLMTSALVASTPYAPVTATCRQVVAYVLATIGATLQTGVDDAQLLPNTVSWAPGQSGWDFLEPILQASGLRLYCDELRRWWLVQSDTFAPGYLQLQHDTNLVSVGDTIDLDSGGYYDAVVVTYTYEDSTGATHTAYDIAQPGSGTYDLGTSGTATQVLDPTITGGGASVMQGAAQPVPGGDWYVWHAVPGSNGSISPYESLVVDRVSSAGALLSSMTLVNAGHGTSIGVEVSATGRIWLWVHWLEAATGLANDLVVVPYTAGASWTRGTALANGAVVYPHSWTDVGSAVPVTSYDWANDYAVMHLGSTVTGKRAYVRRRISDLRAGIAKQYGATILIPEGPPTLQGFTTLDESFFRYVGAFNEPATDRALLEEYSWSDGSLIDLKSTSALGRSADGTYPGDRHEPEGLQVYRAVDGTPSLDLGVMLNTSGSYDARIFRQPLKERTSSSGLRVLSLTYPTPKPANGAARAILKRRAMFGESLPLVAVADYSAAPGMPAGVVTEEGADELQVSLSSVTWHLLDGTMDLTTRDVLPLSATAWLRARPGIGWVSIPAGVSWSAYSPTSDYTSATSWSKVPVGTAWQSVAAGVSWQNYIEHGDTWQQVPAGVSWASVDAGVAWTEYNPGTG